MKGDFTSDKSGLIEISAGTGAQCYRQEARKMAQTAAARAGFLHMMDRRESRLFSDIHKLRNHHIIHACQVGTSQGRQEMLCLLPSV